MLASPPAGADARRPETLNAIAPVELASAATEPGTAPRAHAACPATSVHLDAIRPVAA